MSYHMIGGDGKEYGPFSVEELRKWVTDGRAAAQTQIRAENTPDWQSLGDCAEFADLFTSTPAAAPTPTMPPPGATPASAGPAKSGKTLADEILARGYDINMSEYLSRAWTLLKSDFWSIAGVYLLFLLMVIAIGAIPGVGYISWVFTGVFTGGFWVFMLKKIRGEDAEVADLFAGFKQPRFVPLLLAGLIASVLVMVGLIFCILPGIYLSIAYLFAFPLAADQGLEAWDAMECSRRVVSRCWWVWLGFAILLGLLAVAGLLALCIGIVVTAPLTMLAQGYAYEDIFARKTTGALQP